LNLALPVRFTAPAAGAGVLQGQGLTVDISPGGIRFETDLEDGPRPESEVRLQVAISREGAAEPVFISGGATVLRCEPLTPESRHHTGARWSVAARFHKQPEISLPLAEEFPPRRGS